MIVAKTKPPVRKPAKPNYVINGIMPPWSKGDVVPAEVWPVFPEHALRAGVIAETSEEVTVDFTPLDLPLRAPAERSEAEIENDLLRSQLNDMNAKLSAAKSEEAKALAALAEVTAKNTKVTADLTAAESMLAESQAEVKRLTIERTNG